MHGMLQHMSQLYLQRMHSDMSLFIIHCSAAIEERIETLDEVKAALTDVVLSVDLEALLAAHAEQLDRAMGSQREEIYKVGSRSCVISVIRMGS